MLLQIRPLLSAPALISGQNEYSQTHTCIHTFAMGKHVHQMLLQVRPLLSAPALICGQNEYSRTHTCIHTFAIGKSKLIKCRVGQDHICTVYIQYIWQGSLQIYGVYIWFWPFFIYVAAQCKRHARDADLESYSV